MINQILHHVYNVFAHRRQQVRIFEKKQRVSHRFQKQYKFVMAKKGDFMQRLKQNIRHPLTFMPLTMIDHKEMEAKQYMQKFLVDGNEVYEFMNKFLKLHATLTKIKDYLKFMSERRILKDGMLRNLWEVTKKDMMDDYKKSKDKKKKANYKKLEKVTGT